VSDPGPQTVAVRGPVAAEDQARADFYALLGRLYAAAPDADLLRALAQSADLPVETSDTTAQALADAWRLLKALSEATDQKTAAQEYVDLFVGIGKSEVSLHAAAYMRSAGGSLLAEIRSELAHLGLERRSGIDLYEDHLAAVCETMRVLIGGAPGLPSRSVGEQRQFFTAYVTPWVTDCCAAIIACPIANYYRGVAKFTEFFMAIERDSFAMD
jgi:TorA maturation chaperone TorD